MVVAVAVVAAVVVVVVAAVVVMVAAAVVVVGGGGTFGGGGGGWLLALQPLPDGTGALRGLLEGAECAGVEPNPTLHAHAWQRRVGLVWAALRTTLHCTVPRDADG